MDGTTTLEAHKASGAVLLRANGKCSVPENAQFSGIATSSTRRPWALKIDENSPNRRRTTREIEPEGCKTPGKINYRYVWVLKAPNADLRCVKRHQQPTPPRHATPSQATMPGAHTAPGMASTFVRGHHGGPESLQLSGLATSSSRRRRPPLPVNDDDDATPNASSVAYLRYESSVGSPESLSLSGLTFLPFRGHRAPRPSYRPPPMRSRSPHPHAPSHIRPGNSSFHGGAVLRWAGHVSYIPYPPSLQCQRLIIERNPRTPQRTCMQHTCSVHTYPASHRHHAMPTPPRRCAATTIPRRRPRHPNATTQQGNERRHDARGLKSFWRHVLTQ
jgi:hypothetical protein